MEVFDQLGPKKRILGLYPVLAFIATGIGAALFLVSGQLRAETPVLDQKLYPAPLIHLDNYFTHHVIVAEKSTHKLYLFKNNQSYPQFMGEYQMATGKKAGNKIFQGDHRTPEGIYFLTDFIPHRKLIERHGKRGEIYGVGAFVLNYPNPVDVQAGKTGSGIWLHSTNDETRIEKGLDSRGCIVTANQNLIEVSKYIELNKTMMVVVHNLEWLKKDTWVSKREKLLETFSSWKNAWENENLNQYLSHYHNEKFKDPHRGNFSSFKDYKRAVFSQRGKPNVDVDHLSIMSTDNYSVMNFIQDYTSPTLEDIGRKTLYLQQDTFYNWKIVSENWSKRGIDKSLEKEDDGRVAFKPSLRFFKTTRPDQILGYPVSKKENN